MLDLDPRDYDSRDDERHANTPTRGSRGSGDRDRDDDWSQDGPRRRARDDARTLGRGPGNDRQGADEHGRDRDHDPRWAERDRDGRERDRETGDTFSRHVRLPQGPEREIVRDRDREYTLRGSAFDRGPSRGQKMHGDAAVVFGVSALASRDDCWCRWRRCCGRERERFEPSGWVFRGDGGRAGTGVLAPDISAGDTAPHSMH